MKHYSYHSHTADIQMTAHADSLQGLFETAMLGLSNLLKKNFCNQKVNGNIEKTVYIHSIDTTALLVDFLSEVLLHSNIKKAIYCNLKIVKLTDKEIEAILSGNKVSHFDEDIKAVTYHDANIFQNKNKEWEVTIIFDI